MSDHLVPKELLEAAALRLEQLQERLTDVDRQRNEEANHNFSLRMEVGDLKARLAEVEKERDLAFETWKKFHQDTLAAFIKNEHDSLKTQLAEEQEYVETLRRDLAHKNERLLTFAGIAARLTEVERQRDKALEIMTPAQVFHYDKPHQCARPDYSDHPQYNAEAFRTADSAEEGAK